MTLIMEGQVVLPSYRSSCLSHTVGVLKELHKILSFQPKRKASFLSTRFWVAKVKIFFFCLTQHFGI